jgi:hypothetical protein
VVGEEKLEDGKHDFMSRVLLLLLLLPVLLLLLLPVQWLLTTPN